MDSLTINILREYGIDDSLLRERNISGADLSNKSLIGLDLRGFTIAKINLEKSDCSGADLRGLEFAQANCVSARFIGADFRGAILSFGYFNAADFRGADLRGATIADSLCNNCDFSGADLRGARIGYEHYNSDFRGADLRGITIPDDSDFAKLQCDIRGALVTKPKLITEPNMRRAPRIPIIPSLAVTDRVTRRHIGYLVDATCQGLRLSGKIPFPVDSMFYLHIELPENRSYAKALDIDARCVWSKEMGEKNLFQAGFRIYTISNDCFTALKGLIEEQKQHKNVFFE